MLAEPETQKICYMDDGRPVVEKRPGHIVVIRESELSGGIEGGKKFSFGLKFKWGKCSNGGSKGAQMQYVLFILIVGGGGERLASAEFNSKAACDDAKSEAVIAFGRYSHALIGLCVEKGAEQ